MQEVDLSGSVLTFLGTASVDGEGVDDGTGAGGADIDPTTGFCVRCEQKCSSCEPGCSICATLCAGCADACLGCSWCTAAKNVVSE